MRPTPADILVKVLLASVAVTIAAPALYWIGAAAFNALGIRLSSASKSSWEFERKIDAGTKPFSDQQSLSRIGSSSSESDRSRDMIA